MYWLKSMTQVSRVSAQIDWQRPGQRQERQPQPEDGQREQARPAQVLTAPGRGQDHRQRKQADIGDPVGPFRQQRHAAHDSGQEVPEQGAARRRRGHSRHKPQALAHQRRRKDHVRAGGVRPMCEALGCQQGQGREQRRFAVKQDARQKVQRQGAAARCHSQRQPQQKH